MANSRRTQKQWCRLISKWDRSGLSADQFAGSRRNLNPRTLTWWRSKFRRDERDAARLGSAPEFLPVVVSSVMTPTTPLDDRSPIEVVLVNGVKLRFEHPLNHAGLGALAAAFGGPS